MWPNGSPGSKALSETSASLSKSPPCSTSSRPKSCGTSPPPSHLPPPHERDASPRPGEWLARQGPRAAHPPDHGGAVDPLGPRIMRIPRRRAIAPSESPVDFLALIGGLLLVAIGLALAGVVIAIRLRDGRGRHR